MDRRSPAKIKEDEAREARVRAREMALAKARTPEAKAKAKAYRERAKAKKAAEKAAFLAYSATPEGQAEAWAARRTEFISDELLWELVPAKERDKPYLPYLLGDAPVWRRYFLHDNTTAYVYPTALGWEGSFCVRGDKDRTILSKVAFNTAEDAKGWVYDVYKGPGPELGGLFVSLLPEWEADFWKYRRER